MSARQDICSLCQKELGSENTVEITQKGAESINQASIERGSSIIVTSGTNVHKSCRLNYTNRKDIERSKRAKSESTSTVKRSERLTSGPFDSKTDCFYCGNKVAVVSIAPDYEEYSHVHTHNFVNKIAELCKLRTDEWALNIQGRIEYFGKDLHAADSVYHRSCDINFRTGRAIPMQHATGSSIKKRKVGRPKNIDQEQAFLQTCYYFEENDEEQLTVSDLIKKMKEFLHNPESLPYGSQYLKAKLLERYGDSLFVSEVEGLQDIVTFREKTSRILRDYFKKQSGDEEEQKLAIIETAAKLIKSDIKMKVSSVKDMYPETSDIKLDSALDFIPHSLRSLLQNLFVGKDTCQKEASIGQAIIQAVRPRAVLAPLQVGLAVQMHHHFRSKFLIKSLSAMGFCSSYSEVRRFEENAAATVSPDILEIIALSDAMLLFAADNVDHNIVSLDGRGTFHGMGMIAATTPSHNVTTTILRRKMSELNISESSKVEVTEYRFARHSRRNIDFRQLPTFKKFDNNIDLLWEVSVNFSTPVPNWQGMMHLIHKDFDHPGPSSVTFLPMIDMYPGDKTCIFSTLEYICKLATKHGIQPIVTFDQPLFWKASEILQEVPDTCSVRDTILLLGSFHTFMNLLGAIGTLTEGSGLKDIFETIFGENAVVHMMSGKSVQRAFRGHLLVDKCLSQQIILKLIECETCFENHLQELEKQYVKLADKDTSLDTLIQSDCYKRISNAVASKRVEISSTSRTGKLWISYQQMLEIARHLIRADRTGSWDLHLYAMAQCLPIFAAAGHSNYLKSVYLYLQKAIALENDHPLIFTKFANGLFVIRRTNQYWAGLGSDLVIEQTLMRSLKSTGGLTRGSGMTEHQRALWTMSSPIASAYNYAMQDFSGTIYVSSDQHKEVTTARIERDNTDLGKVTKSLEQHSPFTENDNLRNIITGVNADASVNVDDLFVVGTQTVENMVMQSVFDYSYKRKNKVKTLATQHAIKMPDDRSIDSSLLFQRFLVVSQSGELSLEEVMQYELSPYPPALFETNKIMRKPEKAQLIHAIKNHVSCSDAAILHSIPESEQYVLDGGSILHRLKWKEGKTYYSIADDYVSFIRNCYGDATVVFDGYARRPNTKDNTHQRRKANKKTNVVTISSETIFTGKTEEFLANEINKQTLINIITARLRNKGCRVVLAEADADVDIVNTALSLALTHSTTIIGEDTDLLVLLLYHITPNSHNVYFRSDKAKEKQIVYCIKTMKQLLGDNTCIDLLFTHAFTGCDTTSRIFGVGKKSVFSKIIKGDPTLRECAQIFCGQRTDTAEIEKAGCKAMVCLFNGSISESLLALRYGYLCKKVATAKSFVKPERLPPTISATNLHSRRTYLQIMQWVGKGEEMDPAKWGWDMEGNMLVPRMMDNNPAPDNLLKMVRCNCSTGCSTRKCGCRKHGLECTTSCGQCQTTSCENTSQDSVSDGED